jgi:sphingolipid delta-4 desaturase
MHRDTNDVFARSGRDEPHFENRITLLKAHPEIRELEGYDIRTAGVALLLVPAQLGLAIVVQHVRDSGSAFGGVLPILALAYLVGAILSHWCGMVIHECSHNLAARSPRANRWIAIGVNIPMLFPMAMTFRRYHLEHHAALGIDDEDHDLPLAWEARWIGNSAPRKFLWLFFYVIFYLLRGLSFARPPNRGELVNTAIQAGVCVLVWKFIGSAGFGYLLASTIFGHSLHPVAAHFIHEHYAFVDGQETYSYYGPLNHVTFNVGYHNEHHDFMRVPGWKLPHLRAIVAGHYDRLKSHSSWTYVLAHFIVDSKMGPHRRIVRSRGVHDRSRKLHRARAAS